MAQELKELQAELGDYNTVMLTVVVFMFMLFMFIPGDHGSRGWYDNPQPALRPVFIAT